MSLLENWGRGKDIFSGLPTRAHTLESGLTVAENTLVRGSFAHFGDSSIAYVRSVSSHSVECAPVVQLEGAEYQFLDCGSLVIPWDQAKITAVISVEEAVDQIPRITPHTFADLDAQVDDYILWMFDPGKLNGYTSWGLQSIPAVARIAEVGDQIRIIPIHRNSYDYPSDLLIKDHGINPVPLDGTFLKRLIAEEATIYSFDIWPLTAYWNHYDAQTGEYLG